MTASGVLVAYRVATREKRKLDRLGQFDLPVGKATRSHHFAVLREAGLIEQRDEGPRRLNRLRRAEFDEAFPGLLDLIVGDDSG